MLVIYQHIVIIVMQFGVCYEVNVIPMILLYICSWGVQQGLEQSGLLSQKIFLLRQSEFFLRQCIVLSDSFIYLFVYTLHIPHIPIICQLQTNTILIFNFKLL